MINILAGNINSSFLGKKLKLDKNILNYDICLLFDARINLDRMKLLKSRFNLIDKQNQFFTCLCRSKNPKNGVLIYINSRIILKVIESNNQHFVHNDPRICYVICEIEGWGLTAIIGGYFPPNGGIDKKIKIFEIIIRIMKRILETYGLNIKIIFGADFNIPLGSEKQGEAKEKLDEIKALGNLEDAFKNNLNPPMTYFPRDSTKKASRIDGLFLSSCFLSSENEWSVKMCDLGISDHHFISLK